MDLNNKNLTVAEILFFVSLDSRHRLIQVRAVSSVSTNGEPYPRDAEVVYSIILYLFVASYDNAAWLTRTSVDGALTR